MVPGTLWTTTKDAYDNGTCNFVYSSVPRPEFGIRKKLDVKWKGREQMGYMDTFNSSYAIWFGRRIP